MKGSVYWTLPITLCYKKPVGIIERRSFAGEGLERERFGEHAMESYHAGVGFAHAKANLESLNRRVFNPKAYI
jgi:hypothetical protein